MSKIKKQVDSKRVRVFLAVSFALAVLVALGLAGCLVLLREGLVAPRRVAAIDEAYVFR